MAQTIPISPRKQPGHATRQYNAETVLHPSLIGKSRRLGYARVSTADQSIDMQITAIRAAGVLPADPTTGKMEDLFCDDGISANAKRPAFNLMQKQIWPGDTLVVYSYSRIYRDACDQLNFFRWAKSQNIKIVSLTEGNDLDTPAGKALATMSAVFAEMERNILIQRTKHGMAERRRQGVTFGRPTLVTQQVAREMKALKKRGLKVQEIAKRFSVSKSAVYHGLKF